MRKVRTRKFVLVAGLLVAVFLLVGFGPRLIRPIPENPPHGEIFQTAALPSDVRSVVERACQDCHSNSTRWPWYSRFAPIGNVLDRDVRAGRAFMNLSQWHLYTKGRKMGYLTAISSSATADRMPPRPYALIHPEARLTAEERKRLTSWASGERQRIRALPKEPKKS